MDRRNRLHTFFLRTTVIWSRVGQHIKTMSYKENELLEWAARTAEAYHSLAVDPSHQDCNRAFYTQSDLRGLTAPPELLILTINPYGKAGYKGRDGFPGQLDNDGWQAWGLHGRMTGDVLIKGNPSFGTRESWRMWRRLRNILGRGGVDYLLDDASRLVCTELIFFNTPNAKQIPKAAYALVPHTVELIDILRPKRILCVGAATCLPSLRPYITGLTQIAQNVKGGQLNGIPFYAIPHTSARYTTEQLDIVGRTLGGQFTADMNR